MIWLMLHVYILAGCHVAHLDLDRVGPGLRGALNPRPARKKIVDLHKKVVFS